MFMAIPIFVKIQEEIKSSIFLRIFLVVLIASWIFWLWSRRKFYLLSMKMPGPWSFPIIGNAIELGAFGKGHEIVERIRNLSQRFPSPFCLWAGLDFFIVITEPEDMEVILTQKATSHKDKRYDMMIPCIGSGLVSASGPYWKKHRQIINPSFNKASLQSFQNIYNKHSVNLVKSLQSVCNSGIVDIVQYCKRCTGDLMAEALFGEIMDYHDGDKDHLLYCTTKVTELMHARMTKFWQEWDFIYKMSQEYKIEVELVKKYRSFYHTLVKNKIKKYIEKKNEKINLPKDDDDVMKPKTVTTFEVLVEAMINGQISEQEVLDEFDNLYNPGMDTTYSQVGFFMMILGMHQNCQDKLWNEIKEFYKDDLMAEVFPEHLRRLPYLEMCIKELIRLFPTGPLFTRYVTEDFELTTRNLTIPSGTSLAISSFILHRNPKYWESPDCFIPERFSPEASKTRPHLAYLPFSYGQRNCIGQNMALDMLKTIGVYLIRSFEFKSDLTMEKLQIKSDISVRSASGYKVMLNKRK